MPQRGNGTKGEKRGREGTEKGGEGKWGGTMATLLRAKVLWIMTNCRCVRNSGYKGISFGLGGKEGCFIFKGLQLADC